MATFQAVINPPHARILDVEAITETPGVRDGETATAHLMGVTLACDHRILYGADPAEFLGRIRALLEELLGWLCTPAIVRSEQLRGHPWRFRGEQPI